MSNYQASQGTEVGEDLYGQAQNVSAPGMTTEIPRGQTVVGFQRPIADPRLVFHDRLDARSKPPVSWEVSKDDRMSAEAAGRKMRDLYELFGVRGESPEILEAFHDAIYFAHTMNGGSVLQPGRAKFTISGTEMDYFQVVTFLGNDLRRFNRAYADEIRSCNARVLAAAKNPRDIVAMEKANLLRQVAASRGMSRFPDLAHDSADACTGLSDAQLAALTASKAMIFSAGDNMADRNRARPGQSGATSVGSMYVNPTARAALADA